MIHEKKPPPQCSTFTLMIVASGAIPTVPMFWPGAAAMPATCVPCQKVSVLSQAPVERRMAWSKLNG